MLPDLFNRYLGILPRIPNRLEGLAGGINHAGKGLAAPGEKKGRAQHGARGELS